MAVHKIGTIEAKRQVLDMIRDGSTIEAAIAKVGRTRKGYEFWRKNDQEFADSVDFVRARRKGAREAKTVPDFPTFCKDYLKTELFPHQLRWIDALEGKPPRDLHPAMIWEPAQDRNDLFLFNVPPSHGKSYTLTQMWVTWLIVKDPNARVLIVSKTQGMAAKFLKSVKDFLTHPSFRKMQQDFGPAEGWERTATTWSRNAIYLASEESFGEKDPTVQALGIGGHIYGARADVIVLDDCEDTENSGQWENHIDWLSQDVISRLEADRGLAKLIVIGTRVAPRDMYSEIRRMFPGQFSYLAQPAVLEYADTPDGWKTLWPFRWDGKKLANRRATTRPATWSRVYQQQDIAEDATFPADKVFAAVNGMRRHGLLNRGTPGHPEHGMDGLYVVGGFDPAASGHTAAVCLAVNRFNGRIWLIDAYNEADTSPAEKRRLIKDWSERYRINEWRIEVNAYQRELPQDENLRDSLNTLGVRIHEHTTGRNKWDADFGVASMETLFTDVTRGQGTPHERGALIDFPEPGKHRPTAELMEQLISWSPGTKGKTDLVMAMWFAVIRCREIARRRTERPTHLPNKYLTRDGASRRISVNIQAAIAAQHEPRALV